MKCIISQEQIITSSRLSRLCDLEYTPGYKISPHKDRNNIIYCKTDHVRSLFSECKKNKDYSFVLVTGKSDIPIDKVLFNSRPKNIIYWFGENILYKDEKLSSVPIGSTVATWIGKQSGACGSHLSSYVRIKESEKSKKEANLAYLNFSISTNPRHRREVYNFFKQKEWVDFRKCSYPAGCPHTCDHWLSIEQYLNEIYNHKIIICPLGNGVDTGRFWYSLYLGCIPLVPNHFNLTFYRDLPFIAYDNLQDVNEEFIKKEIEAIENRDFNLEKLKISFWNKELNKYRKI